MQSNYIVDVVSPTLFSFRYTLDIKAMMKRMLRPCGATFVVLGAVLAIIGLILMTSHYRYVMLIIGCVLGVFGLMFAFGIVSGAKLGTWELVCVIDKQEGTVEIRNLTKPRMASTKYKLMPGSRVVPSTELKGSVMRFFASTFKDMYMLVMPSDVSTLPTILYMNGEREIVESLLAGIERFLNGPGGGVVESSPPVVDTSTPRDGIDPGFDSTLFRRKKAHEQ